VTALPLVVSLVLVAGLQPDPGSSQRARHRLVPAAPTNWTVGNAEDAATEPLGGLVLAGGGSDVDAAMAWFVTRASGGDVVVVRASGSDGYNSYLFGLATVDSVQTFLVPSRLEADHPDLIRAVERAEAVFIAGGDQSDYVRFWKRTRLEKALQRAFARGAVVGGTSAGLAVLGAFDFAAMAGTVTSAEALADPYGPRVTLENDFLQAPQLAATITDSHFAARDRMGRLVTFLARVVADGWAVSARGLGIDEATAVIVELSGAATVLGAHAAYLLSSPGRPQTCTAGMSLTYRGVSVVRVAAGSGFDLSSWSSPEGDGYTLSVEDGVLSSSGAGIY